MSATSSTSHFTRRSGLPLLFFALMCPGHGADASKRPSMVRRLLGFSCDPRDTIPGALHGTTMDALATYFCGTKGHDWDVITEPFMSITSMLLKHGSNPNGTLYMDSSNHDKSRTLYRDMVKLKGSYGKNTYLGRGGSTNTAGLLSYTVSQLSQLITNACSPYSMTSLQ